MRTRLFVGVALVGLIASTIAHVMTARIAFVGTALGFAWALAFFIGYHWGHPRD